MVDPVNLLFPGFGLVMVVAAVGLVQKGRFYSKQSERIAETEVSDVESLGEGTVAIEGTARIDESAGTVTTELTGEEALVSKSKVFAKEDHVDTAGPDRDEGRQVLHEARRSVPFRVEDDTGSVRVAPPDEADVRLDENKVIERGRGVPDVADLAEDPDAALDGQVSVGDAPRWKDYDRHYEQAAISPGEEVYVLGEAVDRADWDGNEYEIAGGENPRHFIVSDEGRERAQSGGKIGAYLAYGMGGVFGFVGALLLLFGTLALLW